MELTKNQQYIKQAREALGLTQTQFAKKIGVTQQAIGDWETGRRNPGRPVLMLIEILMDK